MSRLNTSAFPLPSLARATQRFAKWSWMCFYEWRLHYFPVQSGNAHKSFMGTVVAAFTPQLFSNMNRSVFIDEETIDIQYDLQK